MNHNNLMTLLGLRRPPLLPSLSLFSFSFSLSLSFALPHSLPTKLFIFHLLKCLPSHISFNGKERYWYTTLPAGDFKSPFNPRPFAFMSFQNYRIETVQWNLLKAKIHDFHRQIVSYYDFFITLNDEKISMDLGHLYNIVSSTALIVNVIVNVNTNVSVCMYAFVTFPWLSGVAIRNRFLYNVVKLSFELQL